ncbi:MAG: GNAT family N-acetyltransferase [Planctomycetes bacterium]|nr:GNAT family N-acetyltransferase [Planctomycetota bacterium]
MGVEPTVALRAPTTADRPALLRWRADPEEQRLLMGRGGDRTPEDVEKWLARRTGDPDGAFFVVAAGDEAAGFVQLTRIDRVDRHAYLGLYVDPAWRGRGIADAALGQMERHARERLGLRRILLEVLASNERAMRFWYRHGYGDVGTLHGHHLEGGLSHDVKLLEKRIDGGEPLPPIPNEPARTGAMGSDPEIRELRRHLFSLMGKYKYAYNWTWFGRPIIQLPQDVMAMQTLILAVKPDLVIETGVAHGGGLVLYASMMELLGRGQVVGVDIEIRPHNRRAIEEHPLARRIALIEGSSVDPAVVARVAEHAGRADRVLVCLDSNHTAAHVSAELAAYWGFVSVGSYLVVFDTAIEELSQSDFPDRPWGPGNSPKTAVDAFLASNDRFVVDRELEARLLFTVAPGGYLRRVR